MTGSAVRLQARGVGHAFGSLAVLDGIDLDVAAGEVAVLVGPSGCGKSTLLNIFGGLLAPLRGEVRMAGEVAPDCLNPLTFVFQDFQLLPWRSVAGNISLALEHGMPDGAQRRARVEEMLAVTGLAAFAEALPKQLSGGMRQRVGIARALAVRPAVLLMDEPLSALDAQTRGLLLDEFASNIAASGVTTIYVTHNLAEAVRLGDQIVVLSRRPGRIRTIMRIDRPIRQRQATDPDLLALEAQLWALIRDDAAAADRELERA
jgi:NitT/TauT family transport system ATP-binding protein